VPPHLIVLEVNQDLVGLKLTVEWRGSPSAAPPNCPLDQRDLAQGGEGRQEVSENVEQKWPPRLLLIHMRITS
jgi:hypothetical protein